jgi:polysaccharide export outer membrane protein
LAFIICLLTFLLLPSGRAQNNDAAQRAEAEATARSRAQAEAAAKARGVSNKTARVPPTALRGQATADSGPRDPGELRLREEGFHSAQMEAQRRKAYFDQRRRELDRVRALVAPSETELLHLQMKLASLKRIASDPKHAAGETEKNEMGAMEAAIQSASIALAALDNQFQDASERLRQAALGISTGPDKPITCDDCLHLSGASDGSYDGVYAVRQGGYIIVPRIGRVFLAGMTLPEAETTTGALLANQAAPPSRITIKRTCLPITDDSTAPVYLIGEFAKPGAITISPGSLTVVSAIGKSGGVTPTANLHSVKLLRLVNGANLVEQLDVDAMLQGIGLASDIALAPGDVIAVSSYTPSVYVTGAVTHPDAIKLGQDEELGVLAAIARSGGFTKSASPESVFVVRDHGNGQKSRILVNLKDVESGKSPDVILRGRDVIVVPEPAGLLGR